MEFSKSTANTQKRIDSNIGEAFKAYKQRREQETLSEQASRDKVMTEQAELIYAKKNRERTKLQESTKRMEYDEKVTLIGLTEALTEVVKESLLLDLNEYAKINPNYEEFIRSNIKSFLENAEINENITNQYTLTLIENMNALKPSLENGICLTEAELIENFQQKPEKEDLDKLDAFGRPSYNQCDAAIDGLSCNVMDRVAELIDNEREAVQQVDDQLNAMVTPMGVNESSQLLVRNVKPQKTVLEVLSINEANEMIKNGQEYNPDLALANAITYITVLEALDASGLVSFGKEGYRAIMEAAGEYKREKRIAPQSHPINIVEKADEEAIKERVAMIESQVSEARLSGFKSFSDWKKEKNCSIISTTLNETDNSTYDYIDKNGNNVLLENVRAEIKRKGIDLETVDFNTACRILGYKKI